MRSEKKRLDFGLVPVALATLIAMIGLILSIRPMVAQANTEGDTVDIPVTATWSDADDEYGNRPDSVTYNLYVIPQSILAGPDDFPSYTSTAEPTLVKTQVATRDNNYTTIFEGMPAQGENGDELAYLIGEDEIPGYSKSSPYTHLSGNFWDVPKANVYDGTTSVAINNALLVGYAPSVYKVWADEGHENERSAVTFHLYEQGEDEALSELTLTTEDACSLSPYADNYETVDRWLHPSLPEDITKVWVGSFRTKLWVAQDNDNAYLPQYKNGEPVSYEVREVEKDGYESSGGTAWEADNPAKRFYQSTIVTNTYKASDVNFDARHTFEVAKFWKDAGHEKERPKSVTVRIFGNGEEVDSAEMSEANGWDHSFNVPVYDEDNEEISYQILEDEVDGYKASYEEPNPNFWEGQGSMAFVLKITNTYVEPEEELSPETRNITVTKFWNDQNDKDKLRPESITIRLLADGKLVNTAKVERRYGWKHEFIGLTKNDSNGKEISYTIEEEAVSGYTAKIDGFNITNTHTPKSEVPEPKNPEQKKSELVPTGSALPTEVIVTGGIAAAGFAISKRQRR